MRKAIKQGTIFGGLVDVHELEDGTILISGRGAVRALTSGDAEKAGKNGAAEKTELGRFVDRIPSGYVRITAPPTRFSMMHGGVAHGIAPETFVEIVDAYVAADDDGKLHANQRHIARNCRRLMRALAKTAITKMCEEALGIVRLSANSFFEQYLIAEEYHRDPIWPDRFVAQYARWNGYQWRTGDRHPLSMKNANGFFWRCIFPEHVVRLIQEKGLDAAVRYHQILKDKPRDYVRAQLQVAESIALSSISEQQWRRRMRAYYKRDANTSLGMAYL